MNPNAPRFALLIRLLLGLRRPIDSRVHSRLAERAQRTRWRFLKCLQGDNRWGRVPGRLRVRRSGLSLVAWHELVGSRDHDRLKDLLADDKPSEHKALLRVLLRRCYAGRLCDLDGGFLFDLFVAQGCKGELRRRRDRREWRTESSRPRRAGEQRSSVIGAYRRLICGRSSRL